ncbi:hypothetical protein Dip518_001169 [Parelusimicrobium proximum]|uniref:hypothetical protein n=1 Tax=Parelusimicrobium proximum TaxID=3228953 RepID=UPI003D183459
MINKILVPIVILLANVTAFAAPVHVTDSIKSKYNSGVFSDKDYTKRLSDKLDYYSSLDDNPVPQPIPFLSSALPNLACELCILDGQVQHPFNCRVKQEALQRQYADTEGGAAKARAEGRKFYKIAPRKECEKYPYYKREMDVLTKFVIDELGTSVVYHESTAILLNEDTTIPLIAGGRGEQVFLNEEIKKQTIKVMHSMIPETRMFNGNSAEDDPDYRKEFSSYYSEDNPEGTIMINITERGFQAVDAYINYVKPRAYAAEYAAKSAELVGAENAAELSARAALASSAAKGMKRYLEHFFFHEGMHAWQFKTRPLLDYKRYDYASLLNMINGQLKVEGRNIPEQLVKDSRRLVNYEKDAIYFKNNHLLKGIDDLKAYSEYMAPLVKEGTEFTQMYPLLNQDYYNRYIGGAYKGALVFKEQMDRLAAEGLDMRRVSDPRVAFPGTEKYTYEGQIVPLEALYKLEQINKKIAETGNMFNKFQYTNEVHKIFLEASTYSDPDFDVSWESDKEGRAKKIKDMDSAARGLKEIKKELREEFKRWNLNYCGYLAPRVPFAL